MRAQIQTSIIAALKKSELLRELEDKFLEKLSGITIPITHSAGKILFMQHQEADGFYLIEEGAVKIFRLGNDGREQVIHLFEDGEVFGEVPVFQGTAFPASAICLSEAKLMFVPRKAFLALSQKHPEILLNLLAVLSLRLRQFVELIDDLSLKDISSRLAKYLLRISQNNCRRSFDLDISKTALAGRIGTIPATLSRTFKKMQQAGLIQVKGIKITVLKEEELEALASGDKEILI
jgi:CRP/FNR family transcriptional regulator